MYRGLMLHAELLLVVVVVVVVASQGAFWTNRAEGHGQLVLSPTRLPEQLQSSRTLIPNPLVEEMLREPVPRPKSLYFCVFFCKNTFCAI